MDRSPRDFESRASASFTTPASCTSTISRQGCRDAERRRTGTPGKKALAFRQLGFQDTDARQVAIALVVIEIVANDILLGNFKSPICLEMVMIAILFEEGREGDSYWTYTPSERMHWSGCLPRQDTAMFHRSLAGA